MTTQENETKQRKKPGPMPGPTTGKYTVLLEPDLADWAKAKPGGLSELIRGLLKEARAREMGQAKA